MVFLFNILVVLLASTYYLVSATQFCRQRPETETNFCVASKHVPNADMTDGDLYLSISSRTATGWLAVGVGSHMDGALMFILYPDAKKEKMVFSPRTAFGHVPPRKAVHDPHVAILENRIDTVNAFYNITLVCHSCGRWPGADLDFSSSSQPFIWATNSYQDVHPTEDAPLHLHRDYNHYFVDFAADAAKSQRKPGQSATTDDDIPRVHHWGVLHDTSAKEEGDQVVKISLLSTSNLILLHGLLLAIVFGPIFAGGIAAILSRSPNAFQYHSKLQASGTAIALLAISLGVLASSNMSYYDRFRDPHQLVGFLILGMLLIQVFLGWKHHLDFVKLGRRTGISDGHVWLGRLLMLPGIANVGWGVYLKTRALFMPFTWITFVLIEIVGLYMVTIRGRTYAAIPSKEAPDNEPTSPYDAC